MTYVKTNVAKRFINRPVSGFLSLFCLLAGLGFSGVSMAQNATSTPAPETEVAAMAEKININEADAQSIAGALDGIGEVRAEAIVMYREEYGDFASLDELVQVKGVGQQTVMQNSERISFE